MLQPMTHREVLLEAILDGPDDDLPRLAYADACEEEGDLERSDFIRLSVRYAEAVDDEILRQMRYVGSAYNWHRWLGVEMDVTNVVARLWRPEILPSAREIKNTVYFWRGFVREIALTHGLFLKHAEALFNAQPIERVRLIDRVPAEWVPASERSVPVFSWHYDLRLMDTPSYLAVPIWSRLDCEEMHAAFKRYRSRGEANQALEVATLAWGKSLRKSKCSG